MEGTIEAQVWKAERKESVALKQEATVTPEDRLNCTEPESWGEGPMKLVFGPFRKGVAFAAVAMFQDKQ